MCRSLYSQIPETHEALVSWTRGGISDESEQWVNAYLIADLLLELIPHEHSWAPYNLTSHSDPRFNAHSFHSILFQGIIQGLFSSPSTLSFSLNQTIFQFVPSFYLAPTPFRRREPSSRKVTLLGPRNSWRGSLLRAGPRLGPGAECNVY